MKTPKTKEKRLLFFSELYEKAKGRHRETLSLLSRHMAQYRGSDELDGITGALPEMHAGDRSAQM